MKRYSASKEACKRIKLQDVVKIAIVGVLTGIGIQCFLGDAHMLIKCVACGWLITSIVVGIYNENYTRHVQEGGLEVFHDKEETYLSYYVEFQGYQEIKVEDYEVMKIYLRKKKPYMVEMISKEQKKIASILLTAFSAKDSYDFVRTIEKSSPHLQVETIGK